MACADLRQNTERPAPVAFPVPFHEDDARLWELQVALTRCQSLLRFHRLRRLD